MEKQKINHLAVWILVAIYQVIGALWYSEYLFGNAWVNLMGRPESDLQNVSTIPYIYSIIASIITNYVLAWLLIKLNLTEIFSAIRFVAVIWLGFTFAEIATFHAFEFMPIGLSFIDAGKSLIAYIISAIILTMWKHKEGINNDSELQRE